MTDTPRIALIHALAHSVAPVNAAFDRLWPDCVRMNLLDDSLSVDLAAGRAKVDNGMTSRFVALATYAVRTDACGILFTCSALPAAAGIPGGKAIGAGAGGGCA